MQLKRLGRTGLKVTEICMGTMTFGNQAPEEVAHAILDRALEAGVNFIDTADIYPVPGSVKTAGRTEEVVGRWLTDKRQRVGLATKSAPPHHTQAPPPPGPPVRFCPRQ